MKIITLLFALLLPTLASAGVYEDMEEALIAGDTRWAIRLIERGMDVNSVDAAGNTLLMQAVQRDNGDLVDYLLQKGAEINATTANGSTALLFAARFGHLAVVELLLQHKADPNIANERGATAIDWALKTDNTDIAELLRRAGGRAGEGSK